MYKSIPCSPFFIKPFCFTEFWARLIFLVKFSKSANWYSATLIPPYLVVFLITISFSSQYVVSMWSIPVERVTMYFKFLHLLRIVAFKFDFGQIQIILLI